MVGQPQFGSPTVFEIKKTVQAVKAVAHRLPRSRAILPLWTRWTGRWSGRPTAWQSGNGRRRLVGQQGEPCAVLFRIILPLWAACSHSW